VTLSPLLQPLQLRDLALPNRVVLALQDEPGQWQFRIRRLGDGDGSDFCCKAFHGRDWNSLPSPIIHPNT
jgi:hypothetical protein